MLRFHPSPWPALVLAALGGAAAAQPGPAHPAHHAHPSLHGQATAASPGAASVPPAAWPSAFDGYRAFADAPVAPWRESNDTVGRIGGWRTYAREAGAVQPASAPAATPAAPAAGAHSH